MPADHLPDSTADFTWRELPRLGKRVQRVGLSFSFGIQPDDIRHALEDRGVGYLFWTPRMRHATAPVREALQRDRERYVVATGPTTALWAGNLRRFTEKALRTLDTDYIDVLHLLWLGVTARWTEANLEEMLKLKEEGKVRALGVSIHDRARAGELAADSPLDLLMIRYNAAHPGAERDIFPHIPARQPPAVVAYTATAWRRLLKRPRGWTERVPTAGDCYRFCLSNLSVDLVLSGPANREQLEMNLACLDQGPMVGEELEWMYRFGEVVHG
ncbi:MAG: aldo/keto reductase [Alphaproteobacteria bacterium]|nr:aldo/keto reductase [Alphaproteobacteria bacterium]